MIWTARTGPAWSRAHNTTSKSGTPASRQALSDLMSRHLHNVTLSYFRRVLDTQPGSASRLGWTQLNCELWYVACGLSLATRTWVPGAAGGGGGVSKRGPPGVGRPLFGARDKRHKSQDINQKLAPTNQKLVTTNRPTLQLAKFFNEFRFSKNLIFRIFPGDPHAQRTSPLPRRMREGRPTPG